MRLKYMDSIETIVRGVCVKDGHLLVYQNTNFGYICLPGGHVEFWEPMTDALCREWNEEVGCDCAVKKNATSVQTENVTNMRFCMRLPVMFWRFANR